MERISSRNNPVVRRFREMARVPGAEHMLLDGEHLLEEALQSGIEVEIVAVSQRLLDRPLQILDTVERSRTRLVAVTESVLAAMSPVQQPSGIVAIARRPSAALASALKREPQLVLLLSDIQDPGNVGAIVRAAEACGATGVVAGDGVADPFGWKALRGAMGSSFRVPVATHVPLEEAVREARNKKMRVVAAVPRDGSPLPEAQLEGPSAILLGGEGPGLPTPLIDMADQRITIPMQEPVESLNVAIAAALILYEASRQRAGRRSPAGRWRA